MALRKLTARAPKKGASSAMVKMLSENKDCADCDATTASYVDVRFGVFVCSECAAAHRNVLGASWVREAANADAITADEMAYVSTMG
jgi:ADP-ribosylation factor GTPase-activating protein 2/3